MTVLVLLLAAGCTGRDPAPAPADPQPRPSCPSGFLRVVALEPTQEIALRDDFVEVPFDAVLVRSDTGSATLLELRDRDAIHRLRSCASACFAFARFAGVGVADDSLVRCTDAATQPK